MQTEVKKGEVQELLGFDISDTQFEEALEYAQRKQQYIYNCEKRPEVLQDWYLTQLIAECVRSISFSQLTMDLCRTLRDMEKEHSTISQSAHTDNHIVAVSAL